MTWKKRISYLRKEKWASVEPAMKATQKNESQPSPWGVEGDVHVPSLSLTKTFRDRRIPILNVRNLKFTEVKQLAHHHTATMWQSQAPSPGLSSPLIPSVVPRPAALAVPSPGSLLDM